MGRKITSKEKELHAIAHLILDSEDYTQIIQRMNGFRMGLHNKYAWTKFSEKDINKLTPLKRLDAWKKLVEVYK